MSTAERRDFLENFIALVNSPYSGEFLFFAALVLSIGGSCLCCCRGSGDEEQGHPGVEPDDDL